MFEEGGGIFPWRKLGALAVQCVREAVCAVRFARVAKFHTSEMFPGKTVAARNYPPPSPPVPERRLTEAGFPPSFNDRPAHSRIPRVPMYTGAIRGPVPS